MGGVEKRKNCKAVNSAPARKGAGALFCFRSFFLIARYLTPPWGGSLCTGDQAHREGTGVSRPDPCQRDPRDPFHRVCQVRGFGGLSPDPAKTVTMFPVDRALHGSVNLLKNLRRWMTHSCASAGGFALGACDWFVVCQGLPAGCSGRQFQTVEKPWRYRRAAAL